MTLILLLNQKIDKWYNGKLYLLTLSKVKMTDINGVLDKINYKFILYKDFGQNSLWKVEKFR